MQTGDLVILVANVTNSGATLTISATGGQTWTSQPGNTANTTQRIFWARYNGTWSANPSVNFSSTTNTTVVMHVFRPSSGINTWAIDVAQTNASFAAPGGARDVTINGITTVTDGALVFATWATTDDNSWGLQTAGWANAGNSQYRNRAGSDSSQSAAYLIMPTAGPSGDVVNRQTANGGDAGNTSILAFREVIPFPTVVSISRASPNPTSAATAVSWTVTFSKSVTGVDTTDFSLIQAGGVSGASISSVTGSGTTWTVNANTGTGTGTLGLNLVDDDSIIDGSSNRLGGTGAGNGNFTGEVYTVSGPSVVSIDRASANPNFPASTVSWTVTFNKTVTGVDATDFALVQGGGLSGASILSVTGSGATWTVNANTGSGSGTLGLNLVDDDTIEDVGGSKLGGAGNGNGNFTGQVYTVSPCPAPGNIPAGVTVSCVCDNFGRASLNPSTIFGSNWIVSTSDSTGIVPYINGTSGLLRLTENTGNNAKAATMPGIFPAAGNYISVEFRHYAYSGNGADGIAVTLSDYSVTAVPGAFGGSLGYAQKTGGACPTPPCNGFAGGWIGVGIDEFGNYQNPTEGRVGGPGFRVDSVGVRGSGTGVTGYNWIGGTTTLNPQIDNAGSATPAPGYYYQVIVDARNAGNPTPQTFVTVNRDTSGTGTAYATLVPAFDVFAANPTQVAVPDNWQISFTGSTGGSVNIHEIGGLRVCAETVAPPSGGTASGFNAIDEAYGTPPSGPPVQSFLNGHLYMKVVGLPFKLNVAALDNNQILTTYAAGGNKNVVVKLVDNSDGACVLDSTQPNYCNATCTGKAAVAGGSQTMIFAASNSGKKLSADFTLNTAYKNLVAIMSDGTTTACSTDAFSVRPSSIASVVSVDPAPAPAAASYCDNKVANNGGTGGTPVFKAGSEGFCLSATTTGISGNPSGYTGVLKLNSSAMQVASPATVNGTLAPTAFPAATSGTPSSTTTGNTFTYSEAGGFQFLGYSPDAACTVNGSPLTASQCNTTPRGVYDGVATATECASPVTATQCDNLRAATWVGVDSITSKSDCIQNNYSNIRDTNGTFTSNANYGKYGCSFGLAGNSGVFGRFIPDHYALIAAPVLTNRSNLTCSPSSTFTYLAEPFRLTFQLEAQNASNIRTQNYIGALAKLDVTDGNAFGVLTGTSALNTRLSTAAVAGNAWQTGANAGRTNSIAVDVTVGRKAGGGDPDGAFNNTEVGLSPTDTDGVTLAAAAFDRDWEAPAGNDHRLVDTTHFRYGRLYLQNAYGSELLSVPYPIGGSPVLMQAQYYVDDDTGFVRHTDDSCTAVALTQLTLTNTIETQPGNQPIKVNGTITTQANLATVRFTSGNAGLYFSAPGAGGDGYVDFRAAVSGHPGLRYDWDGDNDFNEASGDDPQGRVTFGLHRGSPRHIYQRERY